MTHNGDTVVETRGLTRRFGAITALDEVSLAVPRGSVFGLVGVNGAGKTTLIKHVLGLLRAQAGSIRVFGLDPVAEPVRVLSRIGYLGEESDLPDWMRVGELLGYLQAFYPTWDEAHAEELRRSFEIDPSAKVKHLSKGQRARVGLLVALAYRPELLLLDEPSSGLDPIVRRDILGAIIRTISEEGRTVLFSSHLLDEVERVSDHVAMIHQGSIVMCGGLDEIRASHLRITIRFDEPQSEPPSTGAALGWKGAGQEWSAICDGQLPRFHQAASEAGARIVEQAAASLDEIFVARVANARLTSDKE
ncbi:MAG: ABC transporter ATP-binding protein [Pirellulales bacterium]|nr:ABC transporter ATP-binding protein [Pirellulales bacterium]